MRHMGIPDLAAKSSIDTLVNMERCIKTVYGESSISYATKTNIDEILHGIGQGNGYGPIIWAGISSPLLKILRERKFGVSIRSPITREELNMAGYSFVDDTDQIETKYGCTDWEEVMQRAQKGIELWESLLRTTGGAIEPSKTDWVGIQYEWKNSKPCLKKANRSDKLYTLDPSGTRTEIKQIETHEARRTLGVWQTANGNETAQKKIIISKIEDWGKATEGITHTESRTAIVSTIGRSIRYPLSATALDEQECKSIDKALIKSVLGKMGVVRTAPRVIIFAPSSLGGIGLNRTETDQVIDQVKMIIHHGHRDTIAGRLIRNTIQQLSCEMGIGGNPFEVDMKKVTYLTENTWIESVIRGCQRHSIKVTMREQWINTWSENDEFIMYKAQNVTKGRDLMRVNKVRLYLQVSTLSDIMTADGKNIDNDILCGRKGGSPSPSRASYLWPNIPSPTKAEVLIWKQTLCLIFDIPGGDTRLKGQLRRRYKESAKMSAAWNLSTVGTIYQKRKGAWDVWEIEDGENRTRTAFYTRRREVTTLPTQKMHPISVQRQGTKIKMIGKGSYLAKDSTSAEQLDWFVDNDNKIKIETEKEFAEAISRWGGRTGCDGSYKKGASTACFVIQHNQMQEEEAESRAQFKTITIPGSHNDQSSYRGELGGILGTIAYTNEICQKYDITQGKCTMTCDNKGALEASFGWKSPNPNWKSYDIVSMIREQLKLSSINWEKEHVKGHQDDDNEFDNLPAEVQANIIADTRAKEEMDKKKIPHISLEAPGQPPLLMCRGEPIAGDCESRLRYLIHERDAREWWNQRMRVSDVVDLLDMEVLDMYRKTTPRWRKTWSIKYGAGLLPTRSNLMKRGHTQDDTCPWCKKTETTEHIFRCTHAEMKKTYDDNIDTLADFLRASTTPDIAKGIIFVLDCLRRDEEPEEDTSLIDQTVLAQFELGQRATLNGLWVETWRELQAEHYHQIRSRKSAKTWLTQVSQLIQTLTHSLWLTRNEAVHRHEESAINEKKHDELNLEIDKIFRGLPHFRMLPFGDAVLFKRGKQRIKQYRLRNKENWVHDARSIKEAYMTSITASSEMLLGWLRSANS